MTEWSVGKRKIRLVKGDITNMEVEAFVFYATEDLKLGSGFGGAIRTRGGPSIQRALDALAPLRVTEAVITEAGELKAQYVIHAVGPKFQEPDEEAKLKGTIESALKRACEKRIKTLAFPAMGVGFYGIALPTCARVMFETVAAHLKEESSLQEVIFCLLDSREVGPFEKTLSSLKR